MRRAVGIVLSLVVCACTGAMDGRETGSSGAPDGGTGTESPCGHSAELSRVELVHDGRERSAEVFVPSGYQGSPTALVINFHGRNSTAEQQRWLTGMDGHAEEAGYIAVYPSGVGQTFNAGFCCGEAQAANVDDVGFARALIARISEDLCVDETKVFATGLSNGGYMTQRLACDASDVFTGFSSVAGLLATLECSPTTPRPILHFHGTEDAVVPFEGNGLLTSARKTMEGWAARNGCASTTTEVFRQGDAHCERFDGCPLGADVELCTIEGGGHTWPGGLAVPGLGTTSNDISANSYPWQFFAR